MINLREGPILLIFKMHDLMLFTKMPTARMHNMQNIKNTNKFRAVISFTHLMTKLSFEI